MFGRYDALEARCREDETTNSEERKLLASKVLLMSIETSAERDRRIILASEVLLASEILLASIKISPLSAEIDLRIEKFFFAFFFRSEKREDDLFVATESADDPTDATGSLSSTFDMSTTAFFALPSPRIVSDYNFVNSSSLK